jgi:hypothetical protein
VRAVSGDTEGVAADDLLRQATALGIPWERILAEEIRAERTLRLCLADVRENWPIWPAFWILPLSLLHSWRVRERIHVLAWKASREGSDAAARQLRALHAHFLGRRNGRSTDSTHMARHFWFGYQRVITLARISRDAEKAQGKADDPLELLREKTGCSLEDARWALGRARSPGRGHRLDDVMRRVRSEGFELPQAENEVRAFRRLRIFVRTAGHLARMSDGGNGRGVGLTA